MPTFLPCIFSSAAVNLPSWSAMESSKSEIKVVLMQYPLTEGSCFHEGSIKLALEHHSLPVTSASTAEILVS